MLVKLKDVVDKISGNEDRLTTSLEYYLGGEHYDSERIAIYKKGIIKDDINILGFKFHFPFRAGDTIFMSRNPHLKKAGMVTYDGICSDTSYILRTKDENVLLGTYLPLVLQNERFWRWFEENKSGSVNYLLNWKALKEYEFELPSVEDQKRIADLVWAMEETRVSYEELLSATDDLVKSQFIKMFGRLGENDKGWGLLTLGECCEINPKRPRNIDDALPVSFVPMSAVSEHGKIDCTEIKPYGAVKKGFTYFAENDVLFAKITPCMENGKGAIAEGLSNGIGAGSTEFHVLRPMEGKSNPYWLYTITMFDEFRKKAREMMTGTGGQLRVPASFLEKYPVTLPPIELQNEFEQFVRQSEKSKHDLQVCIDALDHYDHYLSQQKIG